MGPLTPRRGSQSVAALLAIALLLVVFALPSAPVQIAQAIAPDAAAAVVPTATHGAACAMAGRWRGSDKEMTHATA